MIMLRLVTQTILLTRYQIILAIKIDATLLFTGQKGGDLFWVDSGN